MQHRQASEKAGEASRQHSSEVSPAPSSPAPGSPSGSPPGPGSPTPGSPARSSPAPGSSAHSSPARRIALTAMLAALALVFSWLESIIPFQPGLPGVKLGLANFVIVTAMYRLNNRYALAINVIRVILAGLMFSGVFGMLYSLAGSLLSFAVMALVRRTGVFSAVGVSVAGGVAHNMGQLLIAMLVVSSLSLGYYLPVLWFSGMAAGLVVGLGAAALIHRLPAGLAMNQAG